MYYLYDVYIPAPAHYMTIICRDIVWDFPVPLRYRTELCLWPWIRSTTLPCRPLDYWHLCYSQYSPSSTFLQYLIDEASLEFQYITHKLPFLKKIFLAWWRALFILSPKLCLKWTGSKTSHCHVHLQPSFIHVAVKIFTQIWSVTVARSADLINCLYCFTLHCF